MPITKVTGVYFIRDWIYINVYGRLNSGDYGIIYLYKWEAPFVNIYLRIVKRRIL